ncbi:MAG: hypothetical protein P1V97_27160 [Planctomycetota bacterium]|nr:hypothetical protein [Planctomycetota bacterium]
MDNTAIKGEFCEIRMIVGLIMLFIGIVDPIIMLFIASRAEKDNPNRLILAGAGVMSGLTFMAIGVAFMTKMIGGQ